MRNVEYGKWWAIPTKAIAHAVQAANNHPVTMAVNFEALGENDSSVINVGK